MRWQNEPALVSTEWLGERLNAPDIRIVDASWHLPDSDRDARADYDDAHIPGAVFFDLDDLSDESDGLPHMLPPAEKFSSRMRRLGIGDGNKVIVYDTGGVHAAARAWWMFRVFGHGDVAVLDGGLPKWRREGRPIDDLPPMPRVRHFSARLQMPLIADAAKVEKAIEAGSAQVVDARPPERFSGAAPEPREGVERGHIPGSLNLPYERLYREDGTLADPDMLRQAAREAGVDPRRPVVALCGSGVTACALALAFYQIGNPEVAVYDGAWADWGSREDTPKEKGAA